MDVPRWEGEPGETPAAAEVRETAEETDVVIMAIGEIGRGACTLQPGAWLSTSRRYPRMTARRPGG